jgi:DNA polymerase III subunit alpha
MGAIKGVGEIAVEAIIKEREKGKYTSVYDLVKRIDLRIVNKKTLESLVLAGAFDEFKTIHRAQYFLQENGTNAIEKIIKFGSKFQESKKYAQYSLFGDFQNEVDILEPTLVGCEPWNPLLKLSKEKEVVGIYLSAHPLDEYKLESNYFTNLSLEKLNKDFMNLIGQEFSICGIISEFQERTAMKSGKKYSIFSLEDYTGTREFRMFGEEYLKYKHLLCIDTFLHLKIKFGKWQSGDLRIEILQINLLEEVIEKLSKEITLNVAIENLNLEFIDKLQKLIFRYPGEKKLHFLVFDVFFKTQLNFFSRKVKLNINRAFLEELSLISEYLSFKIN